MFDYLFPLYLAVCAIRLDSRGPVIVWFTDTWNFSASSWSGRRQSWLVEISHALRSQQLFTLKRNVSWLILKLISSATIKISCRLFIISSLWCRIFWLTFFWRASGLVIYWIFRDQPLQKIICCIARISNSYLLIKKFVFDFQNNIPLEIHWIQSKQSLSKPSPLHNNAGLGNNRPFV